MAHRTPVVEHDTLVGLADGPIVVATRAWFAWLDGATTFAVVLDEGHFTAHKERASNGRGGWYWRAYRRTRGRLVRAYLGASADLSLERLRLAAARLAQPVEATRTRRPAPPDVARSQPGVLEQLVDVRPGFHASEHSFPLRLRLLGDFSLSWGDDATIEVKSTRMRSLLAYLALHRGPGPTRQQLSYLFWPDSSEAQARNNLRQLVHQLRRTWAECDRWLNIGASRLVWRRDVRVDVDVDAFEHTVARADEAEQVSDVYTHRQALAQAVVTYGGDLLPGCYEDWIASDRERLRQAYVRVLDRMISLCEDQGDYAAAVEHALRRLRHDPLDEQSYRRLMHLHALNDDYVSALRVYHSCVSMLERELAVQPSAATRQIYANLLSGDAHAIVPQPRSSTLAAEAALVGRAIEWRQLQAAWHDAIEGSSRFVVLSGEAGIGKSRLAEELLRWASH